MKESEKAERNVNAREIIANVLKELGMNAPSFAQAIGIAYMRIFDLQRGRTKKFNPGVVNAICNAFPQINKAYLYTGEGSVLNGEDVSDDSYSEQSQVPCSTSSEVFATLDKVLDIYKRINERYEELDTRYMKLMEKERELLGKERELSEREIELARKEKLAK